MNGVQSRFFWIFVLMWGFKPSLTKNRCLLVNPNNFSWDLTDQQYVILPPIDLGEFPNQNTNWTVTLSTEIDFGGIIIYNVIDSQRLFKMPKPDCTPEGLCSIQLPNASVAGILNEPELKFTFCTTDGRLGKTTFEFLSNPSYFFNLWIESVAESDAMLICNCNHSCLKQESNFPRYCENLQIELSPRRYKEYIKILSCDGSTAYYLGNLVPNRSYQLRARLRYNDGSLWSNWSTWRNLHTKTIPELVLGYGANSQSIYVESNEWDLVIDHEKISNLNNQDSHICSKSGLLQNISSVNDGIYTIIRWDNYNDPLQNSMTLRIIWSDKPYEHIDHPGIHLANHQDNKANRVNYMIMSTSGVSPSVIGYSLLEPRCKYSTVHWVKNERYAGGILPIFQIDNVSVTSDLKASQADVVWQIVPIINDWILGDETFTHWTIELSSPYKVTIQVSHKYDKTLQHYSALLQDLSECTSYEGRLTWNGIIKSKSFTFRTIAPQFKVKSMHAVANDHSIELRWTASECLYSNSFYKLFSNDLLIDAKIPIEKRDYAIYGRRWNTVYRISLLACTSDYQCQPKNITVKTGVINITDFRITSSARPLNHQLISVNCNTLDNMDYFLFSIFNADDGSQIMSEKRNSCYFDFPCQSDERFNIYLNGLIQSSNKTLISERITISSGISCVVKSNVSYTIIFIIAMLVSLTTILVYVLNVRTRRTKVAKNSRIELPPDLDILDTVFSGARKQMEFEVPILI